MKIGLYFGSFNPIHTGHLIIATHIINNTALDEVWFVVSPQNPFKKSAGLLNEQHRLALVKIAIEGETKLKASNAEFKLPKPSYTIDSLVYLSEKYKGNTFSVIMGSDSFQNINKWKNYEQILSNYNIYIYLRVNFPVAENQPENIILLHAPLIEISSTDIRRYIKNSKSIRYMVTDAVMQEIEAMHYYKSSMENPTQTHTE